MVNLHRELAILILICLTAPGLFLIVGIINDLNVYNNIEELVFSLVNILVIVGLAVSEMKTVTSGKSLVESGDKGYLSAILTILTVLYFPLLDKYYFRIFTITEHKTIFHMLGLSVFVVGFLLRQESARILGTYFSHELRIIDDQTIRKDGVYAYIRHPAYLGTLLVIIGVSWMFITHIGMLLLVPAIMFVGLRIKTEEEMLTRHFGEAYISYKKSTKKLIPFVF